MSQNHLLSDTIARIKNAQLVKKSYAIVYFSKLIHMVLNLLNKAGYIDSIEKIEQRKGVSMIKVYLKYEGKNDTPVIKEFNVVSKPGKRIFKSYKEINKLYGGLGMVILSTSKGIITDSDAKDIKAGGEVLCNIF
ncbi:30S ribosomal protein S8 [Candidatus Aquarickettsia rohweri]|uniref:Small ribosomal subunit protein uS8 n=1 Tax=Candidatus Aquarickettsia rohweri TaxID=2602574 RepID=A0A429XNN0_9RICK|nr:30S ribosomal protein S8 [Candidatus Aquarickettsia rohweri]MSO13363.1 30S ribosomal protein S8 [Rickettsiales endosymbiont of Trichoplax sp. H2]RST68183.1 30S ribosomal protein S8 [Candidatus Aquarickettsia rohweri]